jgi:arylsulfatase A-like enzyme
LDALEDNDLSQNTIVMITSDHGLHVGSKGLVNKSTLWNDAKESLFCSFQIRKTFLFKAIEEKKFRKYSSRKTYLVCNQLYQIVT